MSALALLRALTGPLAVLCTSACIRSAPSSRTPLLFEKTRAPKGDRSPNAKSWRRSDVPVGRSREIAIGTSVGALLWIAASPVLAVAGVGSIMALRRSLQTWRTQRIATRLDRDLLPFVEDLGRHLRSGSTSIESLRCSAEKFETHAAFAALARIAQTGTGAADTLAQWKASVPTGSADHVRQLLHVGEVIGGLRAQFVDGVAASLRESNQLATEIRVLSDQAKYSAILMSIAPLLFAGALVVTDARAKHFLLQTSVGGVLLIAGLGLDAAGLLWMRRLVRRVSVSA
jgi:tight adherence protein B